MISAYGVHYGNRRTLDYLACGDGRAPGRLPAVRRRRRTCSPTRPARCVRGRRRPRGPQHGLPGAQGRQDRRRGGAARRAGARRGDRAPPWSAPSGPDVPVTVKIRSGLREGDEAGRRTAPRLVAAGAAAVCIHPRTARAAVSRPRRPRGHAGAGRGAARPRDRLRRRGRPRRGPRSARGRRGRRDAGPPRPRPPVALRRDPRRRAAAARHDERLAEVRRFADDVLRRHGPARRRPPAPVLAAVPARRRPRQGRWRRR